MSRHVTGPQLQYLDIMGIQAWQLRGDVADAVDRETRDKAASATHLPTPDSTRSPPLAEPASTTTVPPNALPADIASLDWDALQQQVASCTQCELHNSRTQTVFGVGNLNADWLVIGEAPGKDEDLQGEPFVGRAGQLLNAMLLAIGLQREQVYIANILKCRPPNNRDPKPEEVACCEAYLLRQIELIRPKIILAVGRIAAQNLLRSDTPIGKLRGVVHTFRDTGIPLVTTYHPAYLLRSPAEKRKAWEDLKLAVRTMEATA